MKNPIQHYLQIQLYDEGAWHKASRRFALSEIAQAFVELGKWRVRFPDTKFRLVSVAVTLLSEEGAPEQVRESQERKES